eukprot:scaffold60265_cov37-Tisochrysis_lutea.AAC.1
MLSKCATPFGCVKPLLKPSRLGSLLSGPCHSSSSRYTGPVSWIRNVHPSLLAAACTSSSVTSSSDAAEDAGDDEPCKFVKRDLWLDRTRVGGDSKALELSANIESASSATWRRRDMLGHEPNSVLMDVARRMKSSATSCKARCPRSQPRERPLHGGGWRGAFGGNFRVRVEKSGKVSARGTHSTSKPLTLTDGRTGGEK